MGSEQTRQPRQTTKTDKKMNGERELVTVYKRWIDFSSQIEFNSAFGTYKNFCFPSLGVQVSVKAGYLMHCAGKHPVYGEIAYPMWHPSFQPRSCLPLVRPYKHEPDFESLDWVTHFECAILRPCMDADQRPCMSVFLRPQDVVPSLSTDGWDDDAIGNFVFRADVQRLLDRLYDADAHAAAVTI